MTDLALERFYSLDETIRDIKEAHQAEIQSVKDKLMAAEIEAAMLREALQVADRERKSAERVTVKLITQFATVEAVFAEAKALALSAQPEPQHATTTPLNILDLDRAEG